MQSGLSTLILFLLVVPALGQQAYTRLEADFSVKEKKEDGTLGLTMGRVFYNQAHQRIVYRVDFPEPEVIIATDSVLYRVRDDSIAAQLPSPNMVSFSVLALCLRGDMPYFGLDASPYEMAQAEREGELVVSTWSPPEAWQEFKGDIVVAQKDRQLHGLISYGPEGNMLGRQFFRKYVAIQGLQVPTEVIAYTYFGEETQTRITTFREPQLNQMTDDTYYLYPVPGLE